LQSTTKNSRNESAFTLDDRLLEAIIYANIFVREAQRMRDESKNELPRASAQLRACLDRIEEI
jgi:hypothetical protein